MLQVVSTLFVDGGRPVAYRVAMPRTARIVIPSLHYHVTQRGNRRQQIFFDEEDYRAYLSLLAHFAERHGLDVQAYCLMPNHVHLIGLPQHSTSLAGALRDAHAAYARRLNGRREWTGHVWQGRFFSCPMDGPHLYMAARYVELNPVRAGLVGSAAAWPWSSARAHLAGRDDGLVKVRPLLQRFGAWDRVLGEVLTDADCERVRKHTLNGHLLASPQFVEVLERETGQQLSPRRRGRPPRAA